MLAWDYETGMLAVGQNMLWQQFTVVVCDDAERGELGEPERGRVCLSCGIKLRIL